MDKKIPKNRDEWIKYANKIDGIKKRMVPVVEIPIAHIDLMWDFEFQAKFYMINKDGDLILSQILASNSLSKLKQEVKIRKWKQVYLTTSKGKFSYGNEIVEEYLYIPRY